MFYRRLTNPAWLLNVKYWNTNLSAYSPPQNRSSTTCQDCSARSKTGLSVHTRALKEWNFFPFYVCGEIFQHLLTPYHNGDLSNLFFLSQISTFASKAEKTEGLRQRDGGPPEGKQQPPPKCFVPFWTGRHWKAWKGSSLTQYFPGSLSRGVQTH